MYHNTETFLHKNSVQSKILNILKTSLAAKRLWAPRLYYY